MRALDDPAACPTPRIASFALHFFSPLAHMRQIVPPLDGLLSGLASIPFVSAQMLFWGHIRFGTFCHDLIERRLQEFHVVNLSTAHDYRQRDSIRVDEQAALAPFCFPDLWGLDRRPLAPKAL